MNLLRIFTQNSNFDQNSNIPTCCWMFFASKTSNFPRIFCCFFPCKYVLNARHFGKNSNVCCDVSIFAAADKIFPLEKERFFFFYFGFFWDVKCKQDKLFSPAFFPKKLSTNPWQLSDFFMITNTFQKILKMTCLKTTDIWITTQEVRM